jgi:transcriptional regulator with XRE-family HTH domain
MRDEIGSYRLREIRESLSITQVELAERLNVSQNRVSRIEHGDIYRAQLDTLRRYVEAVGGTLRVEIVIGDDQILIA